MFKKFFIPSLVAILITAVPTPSFAVMEDYPSVKLQGLDKSVGRTVTFDAKVGSTIQYGPLFVKIHACRKAPPIEQPESAAFLQIWEVPPGEEKSEWVFSGWMFASSPALSAMDHPVYDVWVLECTGKEEPSEVVEPAPTDEDTEQKTLVDGEVSTAVQEDSVPAPVDSEAEDQTPEQTPAEPTGDAEIPAPANDQPVPPVTEENSAPQTGEPEGFTAYDLMKQTAPSPQAPQNETGGNAPLPTGSTPQNPIY